MVSPTQPHQPSHRLARFASVVAILLTLTACGSDSTTTTAESLPFVDEATTTTATAPATVAPSTAAPATIVAIDAGLSRDAFVHLGPPRFRDTASQRSFAHEQEPVQLNVEDCPAVDGLVEFGFGSTTIKPVGISEGECVFEHGTEVENPDWDGRMDFRCSVPTDQAVALPFTFGGGLDFSELEDHCNRIIHEDSA